MKTVSTDLFDLIKSLTKQEKRYFKLFAARHVIGKQNKYVLLFNAIDKQEVYDEALIREQFAGEPFLRQLHVAKNYLYKLLLTSLRSYHETRSGDKFYIWLRDAQLLYDRGLYKQSARSLVKARKWATERDQFLQLLEVYQWEHRIALIQNDYDRVEQYVQQGIAEEFDILDKYRNYLEFQSLNDQVFLPYWRKGAIRSEEEKTALKQLFERPLYQSPDQARSFYARYFYHNAHFSFHFFLGEVEASYTHIRALVQMFEDLDQRRLEGRLVRNYGSSLINLYIVQRQLGRFDEIPHTLQLLRNVPADSPEQRQRLSVRSLNLETDYYLTTGRFVEGAAQLTTALEDFRHFSRQVNSQQRLGLYYNLAYLYFGAEQYNLALDWINELLNDPDLKTREDIHGFGRLLNLIIHYELGNDQLLEYIVTATARFLNNRKRLFKVEAVMLKLIRRYPRWLSRKDKQAGFQNLLQELEILQADEFEQRAFEYFNFIAWMRSKAENRSFREIVEETSRQIHLPG